MATEIVSRYQDGICDDCNSNVVVDEWSDGYLGKRAYIIKTDNGAYSRVCYDCFWKLYYVKYPSQRKAERYGYRVDWF